MSVTSGMKPWTDRETDVLVLGVTGFVGRLILRYLVLHPQFKQLKIAIGARSKERMDELADSLNVSDNTVRRVVVNVLDETSLRDAMRRLGGVKVVLSTVGPYWKWGTPVVKECVLTGTHYVDISGENYWTHEIVRRFDYLSTKSGAIIIPSCGYDSLPSDFSAYLSVKALKERFGPETETKSSVTSHVIRGGVSGGTVATAMSSFEDVPPKILRESTMDYYNSPMAGLPVTGFKLLYSLPAPGYTNHVGGFFPMATVNQPLVQRTWGLKQISANGCEEAKALAYGPEFTYHEFVKARTRVTSIMWSLTLAGLMTTLATFAPFRWLARKVLPSSGQGPSEKTMQNGLLKMTNVTSTSGRTPETWAKTTIVGQGDPGYLLTSIIVTESALALLEPSKLPVFARGGGVLTPVTGLGDVIVQRLEESGRFTFHSEILQTEESKKTR